MRSLALFDIFEKPKNSKPSQKRGTDLKSYSFTEPVIRVLKDKAKTKSGPQRKIRSSHNADTKDHVIVFHKRKDKSNDGDVLGTRNLDAWRRFSGRSKSWKTCRRLKLTQDYLELLTSSNGRPVSFGWQFSKTNTPTSFLRGQGLHVNKQSKPRRIKKLSVVPTIKDLDEEYSPHWPLPKGPQSENRCMREGTQSQDAPEGLPKRFLRFNINITGDVVNIIAETSLKEVTLVTSQSLPLHDKEHQSDVVLKRLVVLDLVRTEGLADLYLVQDPNNSFESYHAHAFLSDGLSKNGLMFMRRKADRLRKNKDFYAETVQLGRRIVVMKIDSKADDAFLVKNTQREFPPLAGTVVKPCATGQKKYGCSYAAVVRGERPSKKGTNSNHRAYQAWQERRGIQKPKKGNITILPNIKYAPETKMEDSTIRIKQREIPNIPLANRFASLSETGTCES